MGYFPRPPEGGQALLPYARPTSAGTGGALVGATGALWHGTRPVHNGGPLPGTWGAVLRTVSPYAVWYQLVLPR